MEHVQGVQEGGIRVVIVDDDSFVRTSLTTILSAQKDIQICGEAGDGNEAQAVYEQESPDVLLMDIQMPACSGLDAAQNILEKQPEAKIVFLTTFADDEYIVAALRLGARGYLIKQEVANIAPALRSVMAGQMVLGEEIISRMDALVALSSAPDDNKEAVREHVLRDNLSEREFEVIELIAQGLDNKEIAGTMFISEGTVRNHVSTMLQKLGLKNRTQLAVYYYQQKGV